VWLAESGGAPIGYAAGHWMVWNDISRLPPLEGSRPLV